MLIVAAEVRRCQALGLGGSVLLAAGGLAAGALPVSVRLDLPAAIEELRHHPGSGMVCAYFGLTLLVVAWLRLGRVIRAAKGCTAVRTLLLWGAPLALAPPLFSRDVYSYLAQGAMVVKNIDVYRYGPARLGGPLAGEVPAIWQHTVAPYGPVFLILAAVVAHATGFGMLAGIAGMRLVAIAGVALLAAAVPRLAARSGGDPVLALWLGVLNPLVLLHLLGGAHNDAVMLGLLIAGLGAAAAARPVLAAVLITLAALVKAPALVGVLAVAWLWSQRLTGRWRLARAAVATTAISAAVTMAVTTVAGTGYGWVGALTTPISSGNWSVTSLLGRANRAVLAAYGCDLANSAVAAWRWIGLVAVAVTALLVWRRRRTLGVVLGLGLVLAAVAILGPATRPWYVLWGLIPIAAGAPPAAIRRWTIGGCAALSMVVLPSGFGPAPGQLPQAVLGVALAVIALATVYLPQRVASAAPSLGNGFTLW